jgi:hypothetical protein
MIQDKFLANEITRSMLDDTSGFASCRGDNFVFHDNDALMSKHDVMRTTDCMGSYGWTKTMKFRLYLPRHRTHESCSYTLEI